MSELKETLIAIREASIGQRIEDVEEAAKANGWAVRCRTIDGQSMVGTCDYRTDRINVRVVGGIVTEVCSIG